MGQIGSWLLSLCAAGLLTGICTAMAPEESKKTVKMAGGLLLLLAAVLPFRGLSGYSPLAELEQIGARLQNAIAGQENQSLEQMRAMVEEQCEAYFLARAAEMGLSCTVSIAARMDDSGVLRAYSAMVSYRPPIPTADQVEELKTLLEYELGIPLGRQQHR